MTGVLSTTALTRADVEDFLYAEAAILDEWRLEEWLDLFTIDCLYEVPAPDCPTEDPGDTFSFVHDRRPMLEQRVIRLTKPTAHAEYPHSRTRRLITNVRITSRTDDQIRAAANFAVFRSRGGIEVTYVGRYEYTFEASIDGLKIRHRKAILDQEVLDPHGKISIIL